MAEQSDFEKIKFLIETLSSIKSSLDSIEKDTSRKAINIQDISEQLIIIIDGLGKSNANNAHANEVLGQKIETLVRTVDEVKGRLDVSEARNEFLANSLSTLSRVMTQIDMKTEVSAEALSNIEKYVIDSKDILLELKVKNAFQQPKNNNTVKGLTTFAYMIEFMKNLDNIYKTILAVILFLAMLSTIILKSNLTEFIVSVIKGIF